MTLASRRFSFLKWKTLHRKTTRKSLAEACLYHETYRDKAPKRTIRIVLHQGKRFQDVETRYNELCLLIDKCNPEHDYQYLFDLLTKEVTVCDRLDTMMKARVDVRNPAKKTQDLLRQLRQVPHEFPLFKKRLRFCLRVLRNNG